MTYRRYALERVAWAAVAVFLVASAAHFLFHVRRPKAAAELPTSQPLSNEFLDTSYLDFLGNLARGSLGTSYATGQPVRDMVFDAVPPTLSVVVVALVLGAATGVPAGFALARRRRLRRPLRALTALVYGLSLFSAGLLLIYWVGAKWHALPLGGYCDFVNPATDCGGAGDWLRSVTLPAASLAAFVAPIHARIVAGLVRLADRERAGGADGARRRSALAYAKLLGRDFGFLLGVSMFAEILFGIPGIGTRFLVAYNGFDAPVMEGLVIAAAVLAALVNLTVDLAVAAADSSFRRF